MLVEGFCSSCNTRRYTLLLENLAEEKNSADNSHAEVSFSDDRPIKTRKIGNDFMGIGNFNQMHKIAEEGCDEQQPLPIKGSSSSIVPRLQNNLDDSTLVEVLVGLSKTGTVKKVHTSFNLIRQLRLKIRMRRIFATLDSSIWVFHKNLVV